MGHEIVYCASCQIRLGGLDFENKKAFRVGLTVCCAKCLNSVLASAGPADVAAFRAKTEPAARPAPPTARVRQVEAAPRRRLWPVAAVAAGLVLGLALVILRPAPPPPPKPPEPAPAPVVEAPAPPPPEPGRPAREEWADLERRAAPLEAAERYRDAAAIFEASRGQAAGAVDRRVLDLRRKAESLYPAARERERVARWGYPDLLDAYDRKLAAATPAPPPPPPADNRYLELWTAAMRQASARRFADAIAALEAAGPEAAADVALLKDVQALHDEGLRAFAARPAGAAVSFGDVSGVVRRAGPRRLELESGDYVEADALTSRALVALSPTPRPLAAAVAACLDGEAAEGAPEKYLAYAKEAAAHRPKADPAELDARKRFYDAERAWPDEERRAEAVVLYRDLLRSEAAVAREEVDRIRARTELPKERFFSALELRAGGDVHFSVVEKAEAAWVRGGGAGEGVVEIAFPALPEPALKLWAYVGGCCAENFAFSSRIDDVLQPVKHSILFLKKTHALHGGPREPKRWEWVAIPLPKYATPGLKRVQLVSDRQGFAVAAAHVSSARAAPPGDVETREQLRKIALPAKPVDESLLGWWKLDAARGTVAVDASGRGLHGTLYGARWRTVDGRAGLWFDGVDDGLGMPQTGLGSVESFTVAFWARPEGDRAATPEATSGITGVKDQRYALFPMYGGEPDSTRAGLGVSVGRNGVTVFEHHNSHLPSPLVHDAAIGGWVHVAVAVANQKPVLYLDGVRAREGLTSAKRLFPSAHVPATEYGAYAGLISDLRVYKRPLSDQEVKQVCGRPAPEPRR